MIDKNIEFKLVCMKYLQTISITALRTYGRTLGLEKPTTLRKADLIEEIVLVLCGEFEQKRKKLGAPIKSDYVDPTLVNKIKDLQIKYLPSKKKTIKKAAISKKEENVVQPLFLQFSIEFSALTKLQKSRLAAFLKTL